MNDDPQLLAYYLCERCGHVFDWASTQHLPNGTAKDGSRVCPRCGTEFIRKFRDSDAAALAAKIPDEPTIAFVATYNEV